MIIQVEPELMARLNAIANLTHPQEYSGMAFARLEKNMIVVYDFELLDIGSTGWTEIPAKKLVELMERTDYANMKGWLHRHPLGNGVPGQHNWSGTDESTIQLHPLGGMPEMVGWSFSMVLTPRGWVGRIDNHINHATQHLEVAPSYAADYEKARAILDAKRPKGFALTPAVRQMIRKEADAEIAMISDLELERDWGMPRAQALEELIENAEEAWVNGDVSEEDDASYYEVEDEMLLDEYEPEDQLFVHGAASDGVFQGDHTYLSQDFQDVQNHINRGWRK